MEGPLLGPGGEDITWPDQVAPRGRKASSTRKIKPQTSNLKQRHMSMEGNMCKTITHMFAMVHAFTFVYAMCVNKHC